MYVYVLFVWGDKELFTRSNIPPFFEGLVETSIFVNSPCFPHGWSVVVSIVLFQVYKRFISTQRIKYTCAPYSIDVKSLVSISTGNDILGNYVKLEIVCGGNASHCYMVYFTCTPYLFIFIYLYFLVSFHLLKISHEKSSQMQ